MGIDRIHSFLVHPSKGEDEKPKIGGTQVPTTGKLYEMLNQIFERAVAECDIAVAFTPNENGQQQNDCRDDLVSYLFDPSIANGRRIAGRLQDVTTHRSGLGLLFLLGGTAGRLKRLVVSRFPADQGIIAEENQQQLSVEFLERVFMKSAKAYKSAVYESDSPSHGFWDGRAIDRQVSGPRELSDYWIYDFLSSELLTTGPAGTKRLAVAYRQAIAESESLPVRRELVAAATVMAGQGGRVASGREFVDRMGLSDDAASALQQQLPRADLMDEVFEFDRDEFEKHVLYRFVQLDNGAMLLAENREFDDVFERSRVDGDENVERFSTEGRIVDERVRKSR